MNVGMGDRLGVGEVDGVGVGVCEIVGSASGYSSFTLFQIFFLPDLTQMKDFPFTFALAPIFLHGAPDLTALTAGNVVRSAIDTPKANIRCNFTR